MSFVTLAVIDER
jgi:hypothetical protein